ncbi:unnamed protein product [Clavelina lepadiformis]|uniref:Uncharacterized protein n=1 Tax=Clavelina lepadiformis TaxID=159417 RepID=A0ABP0G6X4_CLALP
MLQYEPQLDATLLELGFQDGTFCSSMIKYQQFCSNKLIFPSLQLRCNLPQIERSDSESSDNEDDAMPLTPHLARHSNHPRPRGEMTSI